MPDWGWKCHNKNPWTKHWLKSKSKNFVDVPLFQCEKNWCSMTKEHDERLEKEREDAKRRDADLCSQRPGDLLQNLVQTSVTEALTDLGHVTDTQDEPEEVDGEKKRKRSQTQYGEASNPLAGARSTTKGKGLKKKKLWKSKDTAKARDNVQEPEQKQAPTKGSQKRQGNTSKTKDDQGKDKGKGKGTNQTSKPSWKESQPGGKGKGKGGQRKRITSAVNRRFTSLVQGVTETDLCFLFDEGSWRNGGLHL